MPLMVDKFFNQGTYGYDISIVAYQGGEPLDLSLVGATDAFFWMWAEDMSIAVDGEPAGMVAADGVLTYTVKEPDTENAGLFFATFIVETPTGPLSFPEDRDLVIRIRDGVPG